jgi:hypothetical protein
MRRLILTVLGTVVLCTFALTWTLEAQIPTAQNAAPNTAQARRGKVNPAALRELLLKGLKVTRDNERAYVDKVVQRVVDEELKLSIVYASFTYARKRRPQYPYPYFVFAVETLEKREKEQ